MKQSENDRKGVVQMTMRRKDGEMEEKERKERCLKVEDRGFNEKDRVKCSQHSPPVFYSGIKCLRLPQSMDSTCQRPVNKGQVPILSKTTDSQWYL